MNILYFIDVVGTMVFAISGAVSAFEKKLDIFGVSAVAFITAVGGGTLRDVLIGSTPVAWMNNLIYITMICAGIITALIFRNIVVKLRRTFFLFDSIGIAVFTVLGLQKSLDIGIHPAIAVLMGMVSAVFGGVTRDIVCNEIPLIFRKEIYAILCVAGGIIYVLMDSLNIPQNICILSTVGFIFTMRVLAVRFHWKLPNF